MRRVFVIEDDREIRKILVDFLRDNHYEVVEAKDGREASEILKNEIFDIILMDMMLPYKSGEELLGELRGSGDEMKKKTPVVVISAKTMKDTRLEVLRMGADDYIIKPFDLDEVMVRIEVVLRRSGEASIENEDTKTGGVLKCNGLVFNPEMNSVTYEGEPIKLTSKEMQLLELFLKNPQKTFTKANLYESVWQDSYVYDDNTVNVHMSNLRSKLKKISGVEFIETVWGIGYKLAKFEDV